MGTAVGMGAATAQPQFQPVAQPVITQAIQPVAAIPSYDRAAVSTSSTYNPSDGLNFFGQQRLSLQGEACCNDCCPPGCCPKQQITVYEKAMEIMTPCAYPHPCLFGFGLWVCVEKQQMIMRHRFVGVNKVSTWVYPCCCCPQDSIEFQVKGESRFKKGGITRTYVFKPTATLSPTQMNILYDFVFGTVAKDTFAENAHGIAHLTNDGVIETPVVKMNATLGKMSGAP